MKKKFKIITALAAGLLILSAGVVIYLKSRQFTEHLKTVINKRGSDYLQSEVSVGRIDTDIFNNLVLSNVIIDDPATSEKDIYIPKIKVKYSFIKILKKIRNIPDLISAVSLYNPKFNIVKSSEGFRIPGLEEINKAGSGNGAVPPWKFNIVDADITMIISSTQTYQSTDFNSTVMLSGYPEIYARSNFSVEGIGPGIDIEARYHIIDKKVNADIVIPVFNLKSLGEIDVGYRKVKFEKGTASLSLNADGRINTFDDLLETVDINGEVKISDAISGPLEIVNADINISPKRLRIERSALRWNNEMINVTGRVNDYLRDPYLDIEVNGEIDARELRGQSKIENISGIFDVEGYLRGRPGMLEAGGRVSMDEGTVRGYKINNLNTTAQISTSTIKIGAGEMGVAGGRIRWTGQWDIQNDFDITATAEEISMARLTGVDRIRGTMSGDITARGKSEAPTINSNVTIENFAVPGKNFGRLDAQFNYSNSEIRVNGFSIDNTYSIDGRLHLTDQQRRLNIDSLEIKGAEGGFVKSTGYMRYSPFLMEIETTGTDISHIDLPGFTKLYEETSGSFSFSGDVSIKSDEARIGGRVTTDNLMLGSRNYRGESNIGYQFKEGRKVFQIDGLNINETVKGGIEMVYEKEKLTLESSSITAVSADLGNILRVFKLPYDKIDGKVSGSFIFSAGQGRGSFASENILYGKDSLGEFTAHFNYDGNLWDIDEILLNSETGSLRIGGNVSNNQDLNIELNGYEFDGRLFNGRGNYRGGKSKNKNYSYNLQMNNLSVSGSTWSNISITGEYEESLAWAEIKVDDTLAGRVSAGFKEKNELRGKLNVNNLKVENILTALKLESVFSSDFQGDLFGVLNIEGTKQEPRLGLTKSKIKGTAGGIPFEGRTDLVYGEKTLVFNNFSGNIGDRGQYEIEGSFGGKENSPAEFSFEDIDLKILESLEAFPAASGRGEISGNISGDISSPAVVLNFTARDLTVGEEKISRLNIINARYKQGEFNIKEAGVELENGALSLKEGNIVVAPGGRIKTAAAIKFENFTAGPVTVFGSADFEGYINREPFMAELEVSPKNILVNRLKVDSPLKLTYKNNRLNLTESKGFSAQIDFEPAGRVNIVSELNRGGEELFSASGYFEGGRGLKGNIKATNFEINNVIRMLDSSVDYYGLSNFALSVNKSTGQLYAQGVISVSSGKYNDIGVDRLKADFSYKNGELILNESYIRDANFLEITAAGKVGEESDMDVDIKRLSLAGLKEITEEVDSASGYFSGKYHISGPIRKPSITGRAELSGGRVEGRAVFDRIKEIDCLLVASGSRVNIENFSAVWDPGKIAGSGYIDFTDSRLNYDILLKTVADEGVVVKVPGLDIPQSGLFGRFLTLPTSGQAKGVARFFLDDNVPRLDADIILEDAQFTYPPASRDEQPFGSDLLDRIILNIDLAAGKSVWYENTYARLKLDGTINFFKERQGSLVVNGELTSNQGELAYLNRTFKIQSARLIFEDSKEYISATATSDVSRRTEDGDWVDDEVSLIIPQDRLGNITPRFSSQDFEEDKTSADSAAIAIAGEDFSRLNQQERRDLLRRELLRAIDANLTSPLVKNILSKTSIIDVARVDIGLSDEASDGSVTIERTGLEIGSNLTDKLYMGYYMQMGAGYENKLRLSHELDMLYRLQTNQFLRGTFDEERGFFLGLEHRIKF